MNSYENSENSFPEGYGAECFSSPTAETMQAFNTELERLPNITDRIGTVEEVSLTKSIAAPDNSGYLTIVDCGLYKHQPLNGPLDERVKLNVSIAQRVEAPTSDLSELIQREPLKKRTFMHGQVYKHIRGGASLSDEEFSAAMAHLEVTLPEVQWEWINKALRLAGTPQHDVFLPFLITNLLDTSPFQRQVSRSKEYYLENISFSNGAHLTKTRWCDANAMRLYYQSEWQPIRRIILTCDNKEYRYEAYADGTEQIAIHNVHEKYTPISPRERSSGLYGLTESQVRAFTHVLQEALNSGVRF